MPGLKLLPINLPSEEHSDIIEVGVGENPRSLKRYVNLLAFTVSLAETLKENTTLGVFLITGFFKPQGI